MKNAREELAKRMVPVLDRESGMFWGEQSAGVIIYCSLGQDLEIYARGDVEQLEQIVWDLTETVENMTTWIGRHKVDDESHVGEVGEQHVLSDIL